MLIKKEANIGEIVETLHGMMKEITKQRCTSENVYAACACAGKILDFFNFNLELKKLKLLENKKNLMIDSK